MDYFGLLIIITYLYAIFVFILETKVTFIKAGISKIIFLVLFFMCLYALITDTYYELWLKLLLFIPLTYMLVIILSEDILRLVKKTNIKTSRTKTMSVNNDLADQLYQSVEFLSRHRVGALITVERSVDLSKIINKSLLLNADVSKELLTSIFMPNTPLHDGAVIIRGNKILCAKAYYPSSKRTDLPMNLGTRHRAAIGISEQSDAFTIVVSEETGNVSITVNKEIEYNISRETLNLYFEKFLRID